MTFYELIPGSWGTTRVPRRRTTTDWASSFQNEIDTIFKDFFGALDKPSNAQESRFNPLLNLEETEKEVVVSLEVPGIDEKNIDITFDNDKLVVKGEKHFEKKEGEGQNRTYYESSYGSFMRVVPLPTEIDHDKVDASLKHGVLTVKLPKLAPEKSATRKISVRKEA